LLIFSRRCFFPALRTFLAPRVFFFSWDGMVVQWPCTALETVYGSIRF
jgi:hypothetical protein